jgi:hypothetical protein
MTQSHQGELGGNMKNWLGAVRGSGRAGLAWVVGWGLVGVLIAHIVDYDRSVGD